MLRHYLPSLLLSVLLMGFVAADAVRISYVIDDSSELYLKGSSNVTKFTCSCQCYDQEEVYRLEIDESSRIFYSFENATLNLRTAGLDCGHKGINRDLYRTMRGDEFPFISIKLQEARLKDDRLAEDLWKGNLPLNVTTTITLAGVSKDVTMSVTAQQLAPDMYRFFCSTRLLMSDFGLEPPSPLFGLIKVDDEIVITIDLIILTNGSWS